MSKSFTQRLPAWGPYSKWYAGTSHVADETSGMRFDLSVFPAFYRRKLDLPNVTWESSYHPWRAAADLSSWTYRFELEWRDRVYADITYRAVDDDTQEISVELVNDTDVPQALSLYWLAGCHYPSVRPYSTEPLVRDTLRLPPGATWLAAIDCKTIAFARPKPTNNLMHDGLRRGERRASGTIGGSFLGGEFGADAGDRIDWADESSALKLAHARVRCRAPQGAAFSLDGLRVAVPAVPAWQWVDVPRTHAGPLALVSLGVGAFDVDGVVLFPESERAETPVEPGQLRYRPQIAVDGSHVRLKYADISCAYEIEIPAGEKFDLREVNTDEPDRFLRQRVNHNVPGAIREEGATRWWTNPRVQPVDLAPRERRTTVSRVKAARTHAAAPAKRRAAAFEVVPERKNPAAAPYAFGHQLLSAALATNVVFPVYCKRQYIKHYTPGRWWDCLYTWDSGFVALGLAELSQERSANCLDAYLTEPGDDECAFIHHGSIVPVQAYVWKDLFDRKPDVEFLRTRYASLRQYYLFLAGKLGSSTTAAMKSGLLKTGDYFYNSGGWDDYPPQHELTKHQDKWGKITPVVTTAHTIRFAKILAYAAGRLGMEIDAAEYRADVARWTTALNDHSWDQEAGYFSYVQHDDAGRPVGFYRDPKTGTNFNRGLDGVSPLVSGVCDAKQIDALVSKLKSPTNLWTDIGLTAVDRSAPYYKADGYWNGTVWMPHQWFMWKAMLDLGEHAFAWQVARTALDVWARECHETYRCFEHFEIATGRGAGWHEFGGLSSPVVCWYGAYFQPGRVTTGLDTWVERLDVAGDGRSLSATLRAQGSGTSAVLVTLAGDSMDVRVNGSKAIVQQQVPGCLAVMIDGPGMFEITANI